MKFSEYLKRRDPAMYEQVLQENLLGNLWQGAKNIAGKAWGGLKGIFGLGGKEQPQQQAQPQQAQPQQAQPQQAQPQQAQPQQAQPQQAQQPKQNVQLAAASIQNDTNILNFVSEKAKSALQKYRSTKAESDLKSLEALLKTPEIEKIADPKVKASVVSTSRKYLDTALSVSMNDKIKKTYDNFLSTGSDQVFRDLVSLAKHEDIMKISDKKTQDSLIGKINSYADMIRQEMQVKKSMDPRGS